MISILLAATVITAPATVEEACDPQQLARLVAADKPSRIPAEMELDRRIASTLAEERKAGAAVTEAEGKAKEAGGGKGMYIVWALALLGLGAGVFGAQRRSVPLAVVAWALVAGGATLGVRQASAAGEARQAQLEATARQLTLTQCRYRISDARMQMMQTRIATTTHDLDEADEDIWGWVTRMENDKQPVPIESLRKLHGEIRESLRY